MLDLPALFSIPVRPGKAEVGREVEFKPNLASLWAVDRRMRILPIRLREPCFRR
jgi:hypothetical protein